MRREGRQLQAMGTLITTSHARELVTLRGDFVVPRDVLQRLWDVESRGACFNVTEDGFHITPPHGMISAEDRQFLIVHFDEAARLLQYVEVKPFAEDGRCTSFSASPRARRRLFKASAVQCCPRS